MKSVFWKCYPPYIDAYSTSPCTDEYNKVSKATALADLRKAMESYIHSWGAKAIGEQVIRNGEPETIDGKLVLCLGRAYITGKTGKESLISLALVVGRNSGRCWWDHVAFVEYDYPAEWNVT